MTEWVGDNEGSYEAVCWWARADWLQGEWRWLEIQRADTIHCMSHCWVLCKQTSICTPTDSTETSDWTLHYNISPPAHYTPLFIYFFLYLLTKRYIQMYCHVQAEQDNKAQITGTNSCPLKLSNFIFELPRALCIAHTSAMANSPLYYLLTIKRTPCNISSVLGYDLATTSPQYSPYIYMWH